jgi:prepilin-type processing-associated H-X9-DG protein
MKSKVTCNEIKPGTSAFSRVDLLAVLVTMAILALAVLPTLARLHVEPQATQCLTNLRQITAGWWMYVNDNQGRMAANRGLLPANEDYNAYPRWVAGDMRGGVVSQAPGGPLYTGIDATNSALLVDPHYSQLAPYVTKPALYHCPVDQSTWSTIDDPGLRELPRVRSYSMNSAIGPSENGTLVGGNDVRGHWLSSGNASSPGGSPWRVPIKESELVAPAPSQVFLLLDEHPESINDACFSVQMPLNKNATYWIDTPAQYHNNGCNFSFADGHVETHRWQVPQAFPPVVWQPDSVPNAGGSETAVPGDPDVIWLAHRTTALAPGISTNHIYSP